MSASQNTAHSPSTRSGMEMAGSQLLFPGRTGDQLATALRMSDFSQKRLIFNQFTRPGQVHVYAAECRAGDRLRAQMYVPVLPWGGAAVPAFAAVARSLPYNADVQKLPLDLPAGYSAIVAPPPSELVQPIQDILSQVQYYPGPLIDTRTLVGGRSYLVVWSPQNHMGKYVLQLGHRWPLGWAYWFQLPLVWWQIRGWFGLSRMAAYLAGAGLLVIGLLAAGIARRKRG